MPPPRSPIQNSSSVLPQDSRALNSEGEPAIPYDARCQVGQLESSVHLRHGELELMVRQPGWQDGRAAVRAAHHTADPLGQDLEARLPLRRAAVELGLDPPDGVRGDICSPRSRADARERGGVYLGLLARRPMAPVDPRCAATERIAGSVERGRWGAAAGKRARDDPPYSGSCVSALLPPDAALGARQLRNSLANGGRTLRLATLPRRPRSRRRLPAAPP
jgi:hypothetical protein